MIMIDWSLIGTVMFAVIIIGVLWELYEYGFW